MSFVVKQSPVRQRGPAVTSGIARLNDKISVPLHFSLKKLKGEFTEARSGIRVDQTADDQRLWEFQAIFFGNEGDLFSEKLRGARWNIDFPETLGGLFKGEPEPFIVLLELLLLLFETGNIRSGYEHDRKRAVVIDSDRAYVPPGPVFSVERDAMYMFYDVAAFCTGLIGGLQRRPVVRMDPVR